MPLIEGVGAGQSEVSHLTAPTAHSHRPILAEIGPNAEDGRGLLLVQALSKEWDIDPSIVVTASARRTGTDNSE